MDSAVLANVAYSFASGARPKSCGSFYGQQGLESFCQLFRKNFGLFCQTLRSRPIPRPARFARVRDKTVYFRGKVGLHGVQGFSGCGREVAFGGA